MKNNVIVKSHLNKIIPLNYLKLHKKSLFRLGINYLVS